MAAPTPGRGRARAPGWRRRAAACAAALAGVVAALQLPGGHGGGAAWLRGAAPAGRGRGRSAARGPAGAGRRTARAATVQDIKKSRIVPKGAKVQYLGQFDPKLRSLLATTEYRRALELLSDLRSRGLLAGFLGAAREYLGGLDIFGLVKAEQEGEGRGVANTIRRDWGKVWPGALEAEGKEAFLVLSSAWKRMEQSRLFAEVMKDVLPDMGEGLSAGASADSERLGSMEEEERQDELMFRLQSTKLAKEYAQMSKDDEQVQALASDMLPFIGFLISDFERKCATQKETLGFFADFGVTAIFVAALLLVLSFAGVVKLPLGDEMPLPPRSQPTVVPLGDETPLPPRSQPTEVLPST